MIHGSSDVQMIERDGREDACDGVDRHREGEGTSWPLIRTECEPPMEILSHCTFKLPSDEPRDRIRSIRRLDHAGPEHLEQEQERQRVQRTDDHESRELIQFPNPSGDAPCRVNHPESRHRLVFQSRWNATHHCPSGTHP